MAKDYIVKVGSIVDINDTIGLSQLKDFLKYKLGNYVSLKIHWQKKCQVTKPTIIQAIKLCKKKKLYFTLSEFLDRYSLKPASVRIPVHYPWKEDHQKGNE